MKLLEINNLSTIAADDHSKKILNGLNLSINEGEVHVIMGPNGGGKSTLAKLLKKGYLCLFKSLRLFLVFVWLIF